MILLSNINKYSDDSFTLNERKVYTYEYPRPSVAADCVIFGFDGREINVLLIERGGEPFKGDWALPGGFLKMDETIEQCARRELMEETNVNCSYLEQFKVYSKVDRDPRTRVLSVAFFALVRKSDYDVIGGDDAVRAAWFVWNALPTLAFDHATIITDARERLRERLATKPIAFRLLDVTFKMSELQRIYELINCEVYDRRNFQKKMLSTGFLAQEGTNTAREQSRPAQLFSFREEAYKEMEREAREDAEAEFKNKDKEAATAPYASEEIKMIFEQAREAFDRKVCFSYTNDNFCSLLVPDRQDAEPEETKEPKEAKKAKKKRFKFPFDF